MHNFCTLFDSNYLSRGVVLYHSLEKVCSSFHLYIFAFDERCVQVLNAMNLKHATVIALKDFEDPHLLSIKSSRSSVEYCWTSTSSAILYVLEHFQVDMCTYLDADIMFFRSPQPLFDELGDNSIMITEHRYTPKYDKSKLSGTYCVQFVTIKNDKRGLIALHWWRDRCIEWCYARYEDGKFGDQKYLDDWTTRFPGVHVMQHLGGGLAAWNIQQYHIEETNGILFGKEITSGNEFEVLFYHFHYVRLYSDATVDLGRRPLAPEILKLLYLPYVQSLEQAKMKIQDIDSTFDPHGTGKRPRNWKTPLLYLFRKAIGVYNIYPLSKFME